MPKNRTGWKSLRTEFCAHYVKTEDTDLHLHIIPSVADLEYYHVIQETKDDDSSMEYNFLNKKEIESTYGIALQLQR